MNESARAARAAYQREQNKKYPGRATRYAMNSWKRKAAEKLGLDYEDPANAEILEQTGKQLHNEYQRSWNRKNPDKIKAQRERYWSKRAQAANAE